MSGSHPTLYGRRRRLQQSNSTPPEPEPEPKPPEPEPEPEPPWLMKRSFDCSAEFEATVSSEMRRLNQTTPNRSAAQCPLGCSFFIVAPPAPPLPSPLLWGEYTPFQALCNSVPLYGTDPAADEARCLRAPRHDQCAYGPATAPDSPRGTCRDKTPSGWGLSARIGRSSQLNTDGEHRGAEVGMIPLALSPLI